MTWLLLLGLLGGGEAVPHLEFGVPPLRSLRLYNPAGEADSLNVLKALRTRIRRNRSDLEALRELASLLSVSPLIPARLEAAGALERAVLLAPGDADLWMRLGLLREKQKYWSESRRALERAGRLASHDPALNDVLARLYLTAYQRSHRDNLFREARTYNRRAISSPVPNPGGIKREIRLTLMAGDPLSTVDSLLAVWVLQAPEDPWLSLIRGWRAFREDRWKEAETAFNRGVSLLAPGERSAFSTLNIIAPEVQKRSHEVPDSARAIADWWHWHDPTPSDLLNPRRLEHQARLVEAELYFGLEEKGLPGWLHAPGEMVVRYGLPEDFTYLRDVRRGVGPRIFKNSAYRPTSLTIRLGRSDPVQVQFVDFAMNGTFVRGFDYLLDEFVATQPALAALPFPEDPREQDLEIWRFGVPGGNTRIEIALALPEASWGSAALSAGGDLVSRLAVYDSRWEVLDTREWDWKGFQKDPFGRLIASWSIPAPPESLVLGIETKARAESEWAGSYSGVSPAFRNDSPSFSDLGFYRELELDDGSSPYYRDGVRALPNPGHVYLPGESVAIGFEVYSLAMDAQGRHRAKISVTVMQPGRKGVWRILMGEGASRRGLIFHAQGPGSSLSRIFSIEIPPLNKGDYLIEVQITDQVATKTTALRGRFRVDDRSTR